MGVGITLPDADALARCGGPPGRNMVVRPSATSLSDRSSECAAGRRAHALGAPNASARDIAGTPAIVMGRDRCDLAEASPPTGDIRCRSCLSPRTVTKIPVLEKTSGPMRFVPTPRRQVLDSAKSYGKRPFQRVAGGVNPMMPRPRLVPRGVPVGFQAVAANAAIAAAARSAPGAKRWSASARATTGDA